MNQAQIDDLYGGRKMKVLNLYAGIGGNRKLWEDCEVTAVEYNEEIAAVYQDHFPNDKVIVADAHKYLADNFEKFDFIWSSPPCQTHSKMNRTIVGRGQRRPLYPDMKLWQEITFLQTWSKENRWVVENVETLYNPLIQPTKNFERHYFWSNFRIPHFDLGKRRPSIDSDITAVFEKEFGYDLTDVTFQSCRKDQVVRNCVHPKVGNHVFLAAKNIYKKSDTKQSYLDL